MTALHLAATHDNQECFRLLVERGANLKCLDDEFSSPLHMAATEGNIEIIKMMFDEAERRDNWVTIKEVCPAL